MLSLVTANKEFIKDGVISTYDKQTNSSHMNGNKMFPVIMHYIETTQQQITKLTCKIVIDGFTLTFCLLPFGHNTSTHFPDDAIIL